MKNNHFILQFFMVFLVTILISTDVRGQQNTGSRNYLSSALKTSNFRLSQKDLLNWKLGMKERYLIKIQNLPDSVKASLIAKADKVLTFDWPALQASLYLEYKQNGNRTRYENKLTERRDCLNSLVIGELIARNGKYLSQIVNGLWATLEESTWEIPAIIGLQQVGSGLPDPSEEIIGLVSAETAIMVATIQNMIYDELEKISPMINSRITFELHKRILDPYLLRDDYWWMGFKGQEVNNWNAWINTNVLQTALLSEINPDTLSLLIDKIFRSTDNFINQYPEDGGCDEGPTYWNIAGGKLIRFLHIAYNVSGEKLDWSSNQLLHKIGSYIYKMHIGDEHFVNFADATLKTIPSPESVYRFGEMFNDDSLKRFGAYLFSLNKNEIPDNSVVDFLETVDVLDQLSNLTPKAVLPAVSFLPDLQVLTARSVAETTSGLFIAIQGGNNGESHNHNDVGNFIIYSDGKPVIIDAGVGTYTSQTFSSKRYELWNMQSQWHNCPLINGVMQKDGKDFKATRLSFEKKRNEVKFSMDLAKAYPWEAFIKKWERQFLFNRDKNNIVLSEKYLFEKRTEETVVNFLSSCVMKMKTEGEILFYNKDGIQVLRLRYIAGKMPVRIEEKILSDEKLIDAWGNKIYRLSFVTDDNALKGENRFEFSLPESN